MADDIRATCARCHGEVLVTEDTQEWRDIFDGSLAARGEKLLGINELVLCGDCLPGWQAEREAFAADQRERLSSALVNFRADLEEHGERVARDRIPASARHDVSFTRAAQEYLRWWRTEGQHKRKDGRGF